MTNNIQRPRTPRDPEDLKKLLRQYEKVLTPQNKAFINELINKLEGGADKNELQDLAGRMRQAAAKQQKKHK